MLELRRSAVLLAGGLLLGSPGPASGESPHQPTDPEVGVDARPGIGIGIASAAVPDTLPDPDGPRFVLEPIMVTGERELSVPPPVVTRRVDPDLLVRVRAENAWDLLRQTAHVEVRDPGQGPGFPPNAVLRGFASDHSSEVLLTVDGVPVNLPVHGHAEGFSDWSVLFPGAVSTLRVIHGPSSPLYGDYSLGGTVEVFTRADYDGLTGGSSVSSFGDAEAWFLTGVRRSDGGAATGLQLKRNEGWRDNSGYTLANALVRGWRSVGDARLEGGLHLHGSRWDSPGYLSLGMYEDRRLEEAIDLSDGGEQERAVLHGRYALPLSENHSLQVNAWGLASSWDLFLNVPGHGDGQRGESDRRRAAGLQVQSSWTPGSAGVPGGRNEFTVGLDAAIHGSEYELHTTSERESLHWEVGHDSRREEGAGYIRWRRVVGERLGLDLGGRLDVLRTRSEALPLSGGHDDRTDPHDHRSSGPGVGVLKPHPLDDPTGPNGERRHRYASFHDVPGHDPSDHDPAKEGSDVHTLFSPKLGMRYLWSENTAFLASLSRGFRSAQGVLGDPARPPVRTWSAEVGAEHSVGSVGATVSLFRIHVSNERILDPATGGVSSAGSSVRQGAEGQVSWNPLPVLELEIGGTYTHSRLDGAFFDPHVDHGHGHALLPDVDNARGDSWATRAPGESARGHGDGLEEGGIHTDELAGPVFHTAPGEDDSEWVPGIALWRAFASGEWSPRPGVAARANLRVTGPYVPIAEPHGETDPFAVLGLGASFAAGERFLVDLDVRNALDAVYPEFRTSGYVIPGAPRTFTVAVRMLGR